MFIQKLRLAVAALAVCLGLAFAGGVALRAQPEDPTAPNPAANVPMIADRDDAAKGPIDQTARKEIADLRKRVDALEKKQDLPAPELQKVVLGSPVAKDVVVAHQYVGKILALRHINLSSLANGVIGKVLVKEGQAVKKGDVLFEILPTLYRARLDAERAEVQIALIEYTNTKKLAAAKAVSDQEVALSEAKLARAQAKLKLADAELSLTSVRAPFDGFVGRLKEEEGSVVKEGSVITTLSDNSAVRVYFNVPEARYLELMADRDRIKEGSPVELVLANGSKYPQTGKLDAIEGQFETDTGNIPFRADFPNPRGLLRHGQAGTIVIRESLKHAIVIPQRAAFEVLGKWYVYVVGKDDVAHRRGIVVQSELEDRFVIRKGLDASDRIVVDGVRQIRDGEKVKDYEYLKPEEARGRTQTPSAK